MGEIALPTTQRTRVRLLLLAARIAAATMALLSLAGCGHRPRVSITVAGKHERVPAGTTLAQAVALYKLQPPAGDLLDVQGHVLRRNVARGSVLLDGRHAPNSTRLRSGDRVAIRSGRNRTEALRRELVPVPKGVVPNPQFLLSRIPGVDIVLRGALSHELVSVRFRPRPGQPRLERAVALTFDDGPSPTATPRILAVLRRLHVDATFFVVGYLAEQYPKVVAMEQRYGMAIGNHTYNHPEVPPFAQLPAQLVRDEIALGAQSLARIGIRPSLLRPPAGSYSPSVVQSARKLGERIVLWSVDPRDWSAGVTARQIATRVLGAVRPGSIVILHDGGGDRRATIRALPMIVKGIRHKGLRLIEIAAG
jgi:peptidoglycan/xylan/chitin deacetylase (PgdA/CDA1 family)